MEMPGATRFELNNPPVVAEHLADEVIAIDLKSGRYFSIRGAGARVWSLLLAGHSPAEILAGVAAHGSDDHLAESLRQFVDDLQADGLIRPGGDTQSRTQPRALTAELQPWAAGALRLERFTDMEDMLALDPIHEIDGTFGWPKPGS